LPPSSTPKVATVKAKAVIKTSPAKESSDDEAMTSAIVIKPRKKDREAAQVGKQALAALWRRY
jgi:hypothetical protein